MGKLKEKSFSPNALNEFLDADEADAFLIAYALADKNNRIIVTQEISEPNAKRKVKIPEPCLVFDIKYLNTIELFRKLGISF